LKSEEGGMDAATVSRILSAIPERVTRLPSGSLFRPSDTDTSAQAARIALVSRFLHWLGPLQALAKEDQRALGLLTRPGASPVEFADEEETRDAEADEGEAQADGGPPERSEVPAAGPAQLLRVP